MMNSMHHSLLVVSFSYIVIVVVIFVDLSRSSTVLIIYFIFIEGIKITTVTPKSYLPFKLLNYKCRNIVNFQEKTAIL